jgi:putative hydrolase of the HAD superfamily
LANVKAVIFDYIGTLVNCGSYSMEASREKLFNAVLDAGFNVGRQDFLDVYIKAHEKYRIIRYKQLKEVTNAVWVAEALCELGYAVNADDSRVKAALSVFFKDYVDSLTLRQGAKKLIKKASDQCKLGLISNFTHVPVVYSSLKQMGINKFFNAIVVSEAIGYRKPSEHIFNEALDKLQVKACETVYVGDSPVEDIKGAKDLGFKTIFVESQFYKLSDLLKSRQKPDFSAANLQEVYAHLEKIIGS